MAPQRRLPNDASSTVTQLQSNKEAGQKRPGSLRVFESRASAPRLHQKHPTQKQNPLPRSTTGLTGRGFCETDVFGASPVASALDQRALGATPARRALPYHAGLQSYTRPTGFFCKLKVRSCGMRCAGIKQHWYTRNGCEKAQTGGRYRSTEFVIVVPRPTWRNIFLQKTWHPRKAEKDEMTKSFEQQSN